MYTVLSKFIKKSLNIFGLKIIRLKNDISFSQRFISSLNNFNINFIFDVGANQGQYANHLREIGYRGEILSFEPLIKEHQILLKKSTKDPKWKIYERCALGDYDGDADINVSSYSQTSSILKMGSILPSIRKEIFNTSIEKVKIHKFDTIAKEIIKPDKNYFLKIDTQGYEFQVLSGAKNLLKNLKGVMAETSLVSLYENQKLWLEIINELALHGFEAWIVDRTLNDSKTGRTLQVDIVFYRNNINLNN